MYTHIMLEHGPVTRRIIPVDVIILLYKERLKYYIHNMFI